MFNKVIMMGNLTAEPEIKYTAQGTSLCKLNLASNRKYKVGEETKESVCFIGVTVWGAQADNCAKYLVKGQQVLVEGRLDYEQWETDDGQKRSKHIINATSVIFLQKPKGATGDPAGESNMPAAAGIEPF